MTSSPGGPAANTVTCRRPLLCVRQLKANSRWLCAQGTGLVACVLGVNVATHEVHYRLENHERPLTKNAYFFQLRFEPLN